MRKIVLAIDSFKGSATSHEISQAVERGIASVLPHCKVSYIPIADGGEGTADAIAHSLQGSCTAHTVSTTDALGSPITARYYTTAQGVAYIDLASAAGLTLIAPERHNPLLTTTFGTGTMMAHAIEQGCRHIVLGIGGSATNDAATGILAALGYRLTDAAGCEVPPTGGNLARIAHIDASHVPERVLQCRLTVLADVNNPFTGYNGAVAVFSRQKGADSNAMRQLENGMVHFGEVIDRTFHTRINSIAGGGAAGGVGGTLAAVLGARMESGIDFLLKACDFGAMISDADLVITGEGKIDSQSAQGKVISGVARYAAAHSVPVIALAGSVEPGLTPATLGLAGAYSINPPHTTLEEAMRPGIAVKNAEAAAARIISQLNEPQ